MGKTERRIRTLLRARARIDAELSECQAARVASVERYSAALGKAAIVTRKP